MEKEWRRCADRRRAVSQAEHLRARGQNPFANDAKTSDRSLLRDLRELFAPALVEPVS